MIPVLDDIQNYTNKLNHLIASIVPKGVYIDLDAMDNANMAGNGGKNLSNRDLLNLYFQKGVVVGRSADLAGAGSAYRPIQELENGMANDVMNFINLIEAKKNQLDEIIGFNAIMAASQTHPDQGKAVSQMQQQQTNHAIGHLYRGMRYLYQEVSKSNIKNFQDAIISGAAWQMVEVFGNAKINFLKNHEQMTLADFGMKVEVLPTDEEWNFFYQQVASAVAQQAIGMDDYFVLTDVDNLKQARKSFELRIAKKQAAQQEQAMQQMQQNAEIQQQSAQQAAQLEQQTEQMKAQLEIQINAAKEEEKRKSIQLDRDLELRNTNYRERAQGDFKMAQINNQKEANIEKNLERTTKTNTFKTNT